MTTSLPLWLQVKVPVTKKEMDSFVGERCPDYVAGCATCDGWKEFDTDQTVTMLVERNALVEKITQGEL